MRIPDSRARSTKTRIETSHNQNLNSSASHIREQDPLKQGLKQIHACNSLIVCNHSRARSTKTRIETLQFVKCTLKYQIREQDPLKQGLKL